MTYTCRVDSILREDFEYIFSQRLPWERLRSVTLLISGVTGFLSSYLVEALLYANDRRITSVNILGIARNKEKVAKRFSWAFHRQDISFLIHDVSTPIAIHGPVDFILHAASQASPKYYSVDPVGTLQANTLGTYNLLELARRKTVTSFLFVSAGEIYGMHRGRKRTDETSYGYVDPLSVRSCYAESKRMGETMCVSYTHQYRIPTKIVRLYHTYGPGARLDDGRVFADFVSNILRNEDIVMKSKGKAIRSFCYIADAAAGFFTVLFKGKNGQAYNLANERATVSIKQLAKTIANLFPQKRLKIIIEKRGKNDTYLESAIPVNNPSTKKIRSLGWEAHFSLEEGFRRTIESYTNFP